MGTGTSYACVMESKQNKRREERGSVFGLSVLVPGPVSLKIVAMISISRNFRNLLKS
jgi:hypothetical protein